MKVLRDNKDSVMAMLEAFVYDPLISWRLLKGKSNVAPSKDNIPTANDAAQNIPQSSNLSPHHHGGSFETPQSPVDILRDRLNRSSSLNARIPFMEGGSNLVGNGVNVNHDIDPVPGPLHALPIAGSVIDGGTIVQGRLMRGSTNPLQSYDGMNIDGDEPLPENLNARYKRCSDMDNIVRIFVNTFTTFEPLS